MTHDPNHGSAGSGGPHSLPVRFEFTDPAAVSVYIAGTFNNWQPDAKPMHPVGNSRWIREIVLPIGTHEYCLVVDGKFRPDPRAKESLPNRFGGVNSVLRVTDPDEMIRFSMQDLFQEHWRNK